MLAAVALPRIDLPRELPIELAATAWHLSVGTALRVSAGRWPAGLAHSPHDTVMPVHDPELTSREVRSAATTALPGARVRRLLLWRYLLTWRAVRPD